MERTVLTLMAHPDDAEILCGGLLLLLARKGWTVHVATATAGDCGSAELPAEEIAGIRRQEARRAAALLGGTYHCLEGRDLEVVYDPPAVRAAHGLLREVQPALVITHSPSDYMVDHEEIARVARAACFGAPVPNAPAAGSAPPLGAVPHLYYADPVGGTGPLGEPVWPGILVDISSVVSRKEELLACHASQREWLRVHHRIDEYLEQMKRWGRERGRLAALEYAEGYRQHLGHGYPEDDLLAAELGEQVHRFARAGS